MSEERRVCATYDCDNTVAASLPSGFCFTCMSGLARDERELASDLDKVLRLEAEFVAYCEEHGLPNPHE